MLAVGSSSWLAVGSSNRRYTSVMGKRGLGLPSVDMSRRSRRQRAASLGLSGVGSVGPTSSQVQEAGTVGPPPQSTLGPPIVISTSSSSGLNSAPPDQGRPLAPETAARLQALGGCWPPPPPSPAAVAFLNDLSDTETIAADEPRDVVEVVPPGAALRDQNQHRQDAPILRTGRTLAPKRCRPSDRLTDIDEALSNYLRDKYAASSQASRRSTAATWREYHSKAMAAMPCERRVPLLPITSTSLAAVAALMKLDNFRSFANYLSWAKAEHIRAGYVWSQQLEQEAKEAGRSVNRGLGAARQSADFKLEDLVPALGRTPARTAGEPAFPAHMALLASLWVLREIEAAWTSVGDISFDMAKSTVSWHLAVSKTDPGAKAVSRSWGCLCGATMPELCPFHAFIDYMQLLKDIFGRGRDLAKDFPLFPDPNGIVVIKRGVVRGLEKVLISIGCQVVDRSGRKRYGGHSFRVSGSRYWTLKGLEVFKLQIFARWGSDAILRYVADIPLATITGEISGSSASAGQAVRTLSTLLETHVKNAQEQVAVLRQEVTSVRGQLHPSYVQNGQSQVWHHVLRAGITILPTEWRAMCGWRFGLRSHTLTSTPPSDTVKWCDRCSRLFSTGGASDDEDDMSSLSERG